MGDNQEAEQEEGVVATRDWSKVAHLNNGTINTKMARLKELKTERKYNPAVLPDEYTVNTVKEQQAIAFADEFQKRFKELYPDRRALFMCPKNECGTRKFICTTLRPTLMHEEILYHVKLTAKFVAGFLDFEPLENPLEPPSVVTSPTCVINWQRGDAFDFAQLLCSYLLGSGYDAYCVYGYAPKWICEQDQSATICPILVEEEEMARLAKIEEENKPEVVDNSPYKIVKRFDFQSKFLLAQARRKEAEEAKRKAEDEALRMDEEGKVEPDALEGKRVHCWVLIAPGKRGIEKYQYIEPTTGCFYNVDASPYLGIESVWNHHNYWVNMQTSAMGAVEFNLAKSDHWEYVYLDQEMKAKSKVEGENYGDAEEGEKKKDEMGDDTLDISLTWVRRLTFSREAFQRRYGLRSVQRVILFKKAKLELFAEHMHKQGIVSRLTLYEDHARITPIEIREDFKHRADKLYRRLRYPLRGQTQELFQPGRPHKLKELIQQTGKWHKLRFYTEARLDGLSEREEIFGKKMIEQFEGRDDCLSYRSVTVEMEDSGEKSHIFTLPGGLHRELVIRKMAQKFTRKPNVPPETCVAKRCFFLLPKAEARIHERFHYAKNKITATSREFRKEPEISGSKGDPLYGSKKQDSAIGVEFQSMQQDEKECYQAVRDSKRQTEVILRMRAEEEQSIQLKKSLFDRVREKVKEDVVDTSAEHEEETDASKVDYLTPFLPANKKELTKDDAQRANDDCLKALKERLVERANIIQRRLDRENEALGKRQAAFQRSRDPVEGADEEYEKFCMDAMFRIQILEQRLQKHEETAMDKYEALIKKLKDDHRLAAMHQ